ncbi:MAG: hypothetical protein NXI16_05155 [Alphaproteobacteria bacterium]|nr:hypothetical protein [Alphaproteobacteria bacterium]
MIKQLLGRKEKAPSETNIRCCRCGGQAVLTFGIDRRFLPYYPVPHHKTYRAAGRRSVLLAFCAAHGRESALAWPGLAACPLQPVHGHHVAGRAAIEKLKTLFNRPDIAKKVYEIWQQASETRGFPPPRKSTRRLLPMPTPLKHTPVGPPESAPHVKETRRSMFNVVEPGDDD